MDDKPASNFLSTLIAEDIDAGRVQQVVTRFPPEPNGYLHLGHAKAISVNFGLAEAFGGRCNLRFDDTNPAKESQEYIDSIQEDVRWLGYEWDGEVKFASSYFQQLYDWAIHLVEHGNAYVCDLSADEARDYRGTLTGPGRNSPHRDRTVAENLELLEGMKRGDFDEGAKVLRAKIDMASPNMNLRDPIIYRIRKITHHQTGNDWVIYPTYDFAHGQEDALEGVTHSICTLEFEDHRPLYEWFLAKLPVSNAPRQFEFGRLNTSYTVTSKRKLKSLIDEKAVAGWDDPRMPTISGMRRRGFTPAAIRKFCEMMGTTRTGGLVDVAMLEHAIRDDLNESAPRAMCVLDPIKVTLTDYPEQEGEDIVAAAHPNREDMGQRILPFSREIYIEREDFREEANKKYKRLVLGKRVRLRNAYIIEADEAVKDAEGNIIEILAHTIPGSLGEDAPDGIKPKGVIHWVSAAKGVQATVRLYDRLFSVEEPDRAEGELTDQLNPDSLAVITGAWIEPGLALVEPEHRVQFERQGYFVADRLDHQRGAPVFNRTIGLRDTWGQG
ncbi:MAG: glutaminyl-tRNA synthetase [Alcanivorax sp.]|jgi:glutaminyl-tRNA synthetase